MSVSKSLFISLLISAFGFAAFAQTTKTKNNLQSPLQPKEDELARHLTAAETFQISGDLPNAAIENQAIVSIALQRIANLILKEGQTQQAIKLFNESLAINDNVQTRMNLATAYMRTSDVDRAIAETQNALKIDGKNIQAHYLLGRLFYSKGDYAAALPELESTIVNAPDFDSAYALGVTYLNLQQPDRAKLLFEEILNGLKGNQNGLHILFGRAFEAAGYYTEAEREFKQELVIAPKTPKVHFFIGYIILQHGGSERISEAGKEFDLELQISPQDFYANFFRGVVASSESQHPEAIVYLQKAVSVNPKIAETYLFLGQSQIETGDTTAAEKNLRKAIELSPNKDNKDFQLRRTHFLLGRLLVKSGRKEEGEKELAKAREIQGQMLASARDEVSNILNQVVGKDKPIENQPANEIEKQLKAEQVSQTPQELAEIKKNKGQLSDILAQAYHNLGVISAQQGNADEAISRFAAAAEWQPDFPGLDRNWGITSFRANQFDKAVLPLARHLKAHPEDALVRRMLGISYYLLKKYQPAIETLKPIEANLSSDIELAYFFGICLVRLDRQPEAKMIFTRLAEQNAKSAQAHFYAGQGLVLIGDYENAIKEFRIVAALDTTFLQAHYNAGQSLIRLNRLDEAEKEFRQELAINPNDEQAKYSIAYTLLERKTNIDEAISLLREAIAGRYDYADARYQLGKVLIEKNNFTEAIEQLEIAAANDPQKDYIHYQLSIAYRRAARPEDADRELKMFRELKEANRREKPAGMGNKANVP